MKTDLEALGHSLIWASCILGTFAALVWGMTSCSVQESNLREACIKAGGTVISSGAMQHGCVRPPAPLQR